jgi:hypothetical protein
VKKKKPLARGVWPLVEHRIRCYKNEHGRKLKALELHRAQTKGICRQTGSDAVAQLDGLSVFRIQNVVLSKTSECFKL